MRLSSRNWTVVTNLLCILHNHVYLIQILVSHRDIEDIDYVDVLERPQYGDFAKCCNWDSILTLFGGHADLFERDHFARCPLFCTVYDTIGFDHSRESVVCSTKFDIYSQTYCLLRAD